MRLFIMCTISLLLLVQCSLASSQNLFNTGVTEKSRQSSTIAEDNSINGNNEQGQSSTSTVPSVSTTTVKPAAGIPIIKPNFPRVAIPFVIAMWVVGICVSKIALNSWPKLLAIVPESCCLILAGIAVGIIFYLTNTVVLSPLSSTVFFFCMLPPIIFDAGYFMPNRPFFDHLGTILLFAVMGTIFNTVTIGVSLWACGLSGIYGFDISLLETLIFSSLISAVDPVAVLAVFEEIHVDQVLYIIVFGESLLNDAVTVVLYNMCDGYISIGPENIGTTHVLSGFASFTVVALGGTAIGVFWGFFTGFVTKYTHRVLVIEPVFVFIMSYVAYINAEAFQMSGILSIMFCGITMKNYVAENVAPSSLTTIKYGLKMLSNGSESIIFMFLGITTVNDYHVWNTAFILLTILFCSLYRALGVVLLTEIANYFRLHKLNGVEKFVMSFGGLRGAIAFALVLLIDPVRIPRQPLFLTATISVVFFTVFVQGITIKPLVGFLKVKREEKREKTMNERVHEKALDYTMAGVVDILGQLSSNKVRDKFKQWDYAYIRPYLIREKKHHEPKILETYSSLTMKDAVAFARRNPSFWSAQEANSCANFFKSQTSTATSLLQSSEAFADVDIGGLSYEPSTKDLNDAETHHVEMTTKRHINWRDKQFDRSQHSAKRQDLSCSNMKNSRPRAQGVKQRDDSLKSYEQKMDNNLSKEQPECESKSENGKGAYDLEGGILFSVPIQFDKEDGVETSVMVEGSLP